MCNKRQCVQCSVFKEPILGPLQWPFATANLAPWNKKNLVSCATANLAQCTKANHAPCPTRNLALQCPPNPSEKLHARRIHASGWGLLMAPVNAPRLVCILHLATGFLFTVGIGRPSATRCTQSRLSLTMYRARPTKRGIALYTFTVVRESCVWQQGSALRRRQQNRIELYVLVNLKSK